MSDEEEEFDIEKIMAELQKEIGKSKDQMKNLNNKTKTVKTDTYEIHKKKDLKVINMDPVIQKQPTYSFSKQQRFKPKPKEELKNDSNLTMQSSFLSDASSFNKKKLPQTGGYIGKSDRFSKKKEIDQRDYDYDINCVKQNAKKGIVINPPKQSKQKSKLFGKLMEQQSMTSSIMDELETQASMCEPGPGFYHQEPSTIQKEEKRTMPKAERFPRQKEDTREILYPDRRQVQKQAPGTVMKNQQSKTKQYKRKQNMIQQQEDIKFENDKKIPLEIDRATKKHIGTAIIKQIDTAPKGSREKKFMVFYLLDKLRQERNLGPGQYEEKEEEKAPCMVKIRSHSTERRIPDNTQIPGPNYYYSKDDLTVAQAPNFTFGKEGIEEKEIEMDNRRPLDIIEDLIKKRILGGNINPEQKEKDIDYEDILEMRMGPGYYEQKHTLVEKRTDVGQVKYVEINEKNDRQNNMDFLKKETFDNEDLNPDLAAVKPQIKGNVKMHDPVEHFAMYPPDSELVKEDWKFYDVDLDRVREKLVGNVQLAPGGMERDVFMEHEEFMNNMRAYFQRQQTMPEGYEVNFNQIDKKVQIPNLKKNLAKDLLDPIEKPEGEVDGDNLVLNPSKPGKKLRNINLKKQTGRKLDEIEEAKEQNELQDEIIVNPDKPKKKVQGFVDFKKQVKRPTYEEDITEKREMDEQPPLDHDQKGIQPKVKGQIDFNRQVKRPEGPKPKEQEVQMDIKMDQVKPKVKGGAKW